jgi:hypothetical protein
MTGRLLGQMQNDKLICAIYVDAAPDGEWVGRVADDVGGIYEAGTITTSTAEFDVRENDEFDCSRRTEFPDGFLFFRFRLEMFALPGAADEELVNLTARMLEWFWSREWPAVASCDFENLLPKSGGYKNNLIPWPGGAGYVPPKQ